MIQIVGFGEVVRLEGMSSRKEMRVRTPDGVEHGVEVPESVVKKILALWVESQRTKKAATPVLVHSQPEVAPPPVATREEDPSPEVGEISFGGNSYEPPDNSPPQPVVPKFIREEDDGTQI